MPGFLFESKYPAIQPYQHPLELAGKALQYRDYKYQQGLQTISSQANNIFNIKVSNPYVKDALNKGIEKAMNDLNTFSKADISLQENVGAANNVFNPIINDAMITKDSQLTSQYLKNQSTIKTVLEKHPELYNHMNDEYSNSWFNDWVNSNPYAQNVDVKPRQYTPYYNYNKPLQERLDKLKSDVIMDFSLQNFGMAIPEESGFNSLLANNPALQSEYKTLLANKISDATKAFFNEDPQALQQAHINNWFVNNRTGLNNDLAVQRANQEISNYTNAVNALSTPLEGESNPMRLYRESQLNLAKTYLKNITENKQSLLDNYNDPSAYQNYFSLSKYIDDVANKEAFSRTHIEQGKLEGTPLGNAAIEVAKHYANSGIDLYANLKLAEGKGELKGGNKNTSVSNPLAISNSSNQVPYTVDMLEKLQSTGSFNIGNDDKNTMATILGSESKTPSDAGTLYNVTATPDNMIIDPATKGTKFNLPGNDNQKANYLWINDKLNQIAKEHPEFFTEVKSQLIHPSGPIGPGGKQVPSTKTITYTSADERVGILINLAAKGNTEALNVLKDIRNESGIKPSDLLKYTKQVSKTDQNNIIKFGQSLGKFKNQSEINVEFHPSNSENNIISLGNSGGTPRLGVKGSMYLTKEQAETYGFNTDDYTVKHITKQINPDDPAKTINTEVIEIPVIKIVSNVDLNKVEKGFIEDREKGKVEDIDQRLTQNRAILSNYTQFKNANYEVDDAGKLIPRKDTKLQGLTGRVLDDMLNLNRTQVVSDLNKSALDSVVNISQAIVSKPNSLPSITYNFLKQNKFTDTAVAYMLGTILQESGFNSSRWGDNNTSHGLIQWHNDRFKNLNKFATSLGQSYSNPETQLQFLIKELSTQYPEIYKILTSSNDESEIKKALDKYIGYGIEGNRYEYAKAFLNTLPIKD